MKLGVAVGDYRTPVAGAQQCVNFYPEVAENQSRGQIILRRTPGLRLFEALGAAARGLHVMAGALYAVAGTTLYKIDSSGTATSVGTVSGTGELSIANNGETMLLVEGGTVSFFDDYMVLTGRDVATGYTSDGSTVTAIADADFPTGDLGEQFYISDLSDPTSWVATDVASAESSPDPIRGHAVSHGELLLLGEQSIEFWVNTASSTDFPIERRQGVRQDRGCLAERSVVRLDNTIYFLGDDRIVYRIDEYRITRVSDHAVERALLAASLEDVVNAHALTYTLGGHHFYALTFGTTTAVYDATVSAQAQRAVWHRRASGLDESAAWRGRWYAECYGKHFVLDVNGNIFEMTEDEPQENDSDVLWQFTIGPFVRDSREIGCRRLSLICQTGSTADLTADPQVDLRVSRDGGRTFEFEAARSLGASGAYMQEVEWRQLGRAPGKTGFLFRFSGSGDYALQVHDVDAMMSTSP